MKKPFKNQTNKNCQVWNLLWVWYKYFVKTHKALQGCRPWECKGCCHGTPRFLQISWPYFNQGGRFCLPNNIGTPGFSRPSYGPDSGYKNKSRPQYVHFNRETYLIILKNDDLPLTKGLWKQQTGCLAWDYRKLCTFPNWKEKMQICINRWRHPSYKNPYVKRMARRDICEVT